MSNIAKFEYQKKDLEILKSMAAIALRSEKYEGYNEATILNVFLTARALGVDPMLALNGGFNIIKGKINMGAHFMVALVRRAGHSMKVVEMTDQKCVIIAKRKDNDDSLKYEMTMAEASIAGLTNKQNWRTNPKQMLYCACVRNVFRILFCDIAIPYDADEMNVEDSLKQPEDIGFSDVEPVVIQARLEAKSDPEPKEVASEGDPYQDALIILDSELKADGIPSGRLPEWVKLRSQMKNEAPETIIQACLGKDILPKFKKSFAKWLHAENEMLAV